MKYKRVMLALALGLVVTTTTLPMQAVQNTYAADEADDSSDEGGDALNITDGEGDVAVETEPTTTTTTPEPTGDKTDESNKSYADDPRYYWDTYEQEWMLKWDYDDTLANGQVRDPNQKKETATTESGTDTHDVTKPETEVVDDEIDLGEAYDVVDNTETGSTVKDTARSTTTTKTTKDTSKPIKAILTVSVSDTSKFQVTAKVTNGTIKRLAAGDTVLIKSGTVQTGTNKGKTKISSWTGKYKYPDSNKSFSVTLKASDDSTVTKKFKYDKTKKKYVKAD